MFDSGSSLSLRFKTTFGSFTILPDKHRNGIFSLQLIRGKESQIELGQYCSISEAFAAVSKQESGLREWDYLPSTELPHRLHNIACWNF